MSIGVYAVINKAENKMYIGSSSNVEKRLVYQKSHLKCGHQTMIAGLKGKSINIDDFDFQIIAKTELIEDARNFETLLLKTLWNDGILYNLAPHADVASGVKRDKAKYKLGAAKRNSDPNYSIKLSAACKGKRAIVVCPHCQKSGGGGNMRRFHFDNCKTK